MIDALQRPIHFGLVRSVAPTAEPILPSEAELWVKDALEYETDTIDVLIAAARQKVEDDTGLALLTQTWIWTLDAVPSSGVLVVPVAPLQSVTSIKSYTMANVESTLATTVYRVETSGEPGRIVLKDGQSWPSGGRPQSHLVVEFVAGYGSTAASVPVALKHACRLLVEHWFHHRGLLGMNQTEVPMAYTALVEPYKLRVVA